MAEVDSVAKGLTTFSNHVSLRSFRRALITLPPCAPVSILYTVRNSIGVTMLNYA